VRHNHKREQSYDEKIVKVSYLPVRQKGLKVIARIDADGFYYSGLLAYLLDLCCYNFIQITLQR